MKAETVWHARATGRKSGAIGIFYTLPRLMVFAVDRASAEDAARERYAALGYEHLHVTCLPADEPGEGFGVR